MFLELSCSDWHARLCSEKQWICFGLVYPTVTDAPWKLNRVRNRRSLVVFRSLKGLVTLPSEVLSTNWSSSCSASSGLEKSMPRVNDTSEKSCVPRMKFSDSWVSRPVMVHVLVVISSFGPSSTRELMLCSALRTLLPSTKDTQSSLSVSLLRPSRFWRKRNKLKWTLAPIFVRTVPAEDP